MADNPQNYTQEYVDAENVRQLYSTESYLNSINAPVIPRLLYQQSLSPDKYEFFAFFHNGLHLDGGIDPYEGMGDVGIDDIFVNVQFYNNTSAPVELRFDKFGYQIPDTKYSAPYNNKAYACLNAFSDYYQVPFYKDNYVAGGVELPNYRDHFPAQIPSRLQGTDGKITINPGESFWIFDLSETTKGNKKYAIPNKHGNLDRYQHSDLIQILAAFKVLSGNVQMNVMAYKDITKVNGVAQSGYYYHDTADSTTKGMADSLPEVQTKLAFEINDDTPNDYLTCVVNNQFVPNDPTPKFSWITNINAQSDDPRGTYAHQPFDPSRDEASSTVYTCAESSILELKYNDGLKHLHYPDDYAGGKENEWIFNSYRSDTTIVENLRLGLSSYVPNFMLESPMPYKYENTPVAYSTGNYGVRHHYTITINNTGDARKLKYVISTVSHVIGIDLDSSLKDRNVFIKGETLPSDEKYDLLEWDVPGHQSTTYEFVVLLPTGDAGRIVNLLKIDN